MKVLNNVRLALPGVNTDFKQTKTLCTFKNMAIVATKK